MAFSLKAARVNAGLTQTEVARCINKSKNTVASYEAYETKPDIETALALSALYKIHVDDIRWRAE